MHTPVLLVAFNRADLFEQSFQRVLRAAPPRLYIHIDGPRSEADKLSQDRMARVVEMNSEHSTTIRVRQLTENLGCGRAVNSALDWVFKNETRATIVEDDLAPTDQFFSFVDSALEFYEGNRSVGLIGGYNATRLYSLWPGARLKPIHSPKAYIWGWATWRDRWETYRTGANVPSSEEQERNMTTIQKRLPHTFDEISWGHFAVQRGKLDTWDYPWAYECFRRGWVCVLPPSNLVENIGFDDRGTHTHRGKSQLAKKLPPAFHFVHANKPDFLHEQLITWRTRLKKSLRRVRERQYRKLIRVGSPIKQSALSLLRKTAGHG